MIKQIFDEIAGESSTNGKMVILGNYKDVPLLKEILYMTYSNRYKYYIKQIPSYVHCENTTKLSLEDGLEVLKLISKRVYTGGDAKLQLCNVLEVLSPDDAQIIEYIVGRSCKIGMGTRNINKIFPKLIEKVSYMGAKSYSVEGVKKLLKKGRCIIQKKMDGRFCNAIIRGGEVEMMSRQGEPTILDNAKFLSELEGLEDCVLNGELIMDSPKGGTSGIIDRYTSNGIIMSLIDITKKREERGPEATQKKIDAFEKKHMNFNDALNLIRFTVWDTITVDEFYDAKSKIPYYKRLESVTDLVEGLEMVSIVDSLEITTFEEAIGHFQSMLNSGEEGSVIKAYDGVWCDGKPNHQHKLKLAMDMDLKIVGFNYGTGKNSEVISSLNCETSCGLLKTSPTGMTEADMKYITENQGNLLNTIVEVKCSGLSWDSEGNYSLFHPVYKGSRIGEKDVADSLEDVKAIEAMAKGLS